MGNGLDVDVVGRQAGGVALEHGGVGGFEVSGEALGVEQRRGQTIAVEFIAQEAEAFGVDGQLDGKCLVVPRAWW